jgi:ADP-heptose:LPS heptosyltransferase
VGDALLAAPALRVLREQGSVRLHVSREMLEVAHIADGASELSTEPLPAGAMDLSGLSELPSWLVEPRAEIFARALNVKVTQPYRTAPRAEAVESAKVQFLDQFGVTLADCVGLCFETDTPHRSLPPNYYDSIVAAVRMAGYTPVILGKTKLNYRKVGVADMTGGTDLLTALLIVGQLRAFVGADSGLLHGALAQGVPSVGVFTIVDPNYRLTYYDAKWLAVVPNDPKFPVGENPAWERANWAPYPAVGEWAAKIDANRISQALNQLLEATK